MRLLVPAGLAVLLLAACQPPIPDSRPGGVGFGDYADYQRQAAEAQAARIAAARPVNTVGAPAPYPMTAGGLATGAPTAADLAQAGIGAPTAGDLAQAGIGAPVAGAALPSDVPPANPLIADTPAYYPPGTTPPAPEINNVGISDEQDFQAVASRESIESDKQRIEQNRAAYQQIQPTELPERTGESNAAVDLIQYALSAPNRLGETIYPRSKVALSNSEKACARYNTAEAAQQAFLGAGGPKRDSKNLDPDGDGFACYWDPTPFQQVKN